ncbi:hypothetical protein JCM1841_001684 [Sporobolomyces salmonicolor]
MQRFPQLVLLSQRNLAAPRTRCLSTTTSLGNKASKQRIGRKFKFTPPPTSAVYATSPAPGQAGTDVGRSGGLFEPSAATGGLFEGEAKKNSEAELKALEEAATPEAIERDMLEHQRKAGRVSETSEERENPTGTDVGRIEGEKADIPAAAVVEEVIYTAEPPYPVALLITATTVSALFMFLTADLARVGVQDYDEETQEYRIAPKWIRYSLATGAAAVGVGVLSWGVLSPARLVTKMTLRRTPASANSPFPFPRDSVVTIYHPLSKFPGVKARTVPLSKIRLLGPLSDSPKPYHPVSMTGQSKKQGGAISSILASLREKFLVPPSRVSTTAPAPWNKHGKRLSHSPILIEGDRASYSLALKRAEEPNSPKGAWCKDWDALERALLNVDEARWARKQ